MAVVRNFIDRLHKADYQREFGELIEALSQGMDPAASDLDLLGLNYDPEEGGLPNGSIKFVVGKGLYYLDSTSIAVVDGINVLATGLSVGRWLLYSAGGGGGGGSDTSEETALITWGSPGLVVLALLQAGDLISDVRVSVKTPFNGVGATVSFGTASNPSEFFAPTETVIGVVCDFGETPLYISPVADQLQVVFNSSGSTAGELVIYYRIRRV